MRTFRLQLQSTSLQRSSKKQFFLKHMKVSISSLDWTAKQYCKLSKTRIVSSHFTNLISWSSMPPYFLIVNPMNVSWKISSKRSLSCLIGLFRQEMKNFRMFSKKEISWVMKFYNIFSKLTKNSEILTLLFLNAEKLLR